MKKILTLATIMTIAISANAMSYTEAKNEASTTSTSHCLTSTVHFLGIPVM